MPVPVLVLVVLLVLTPAVVVVDAPETNNKWWCWCFWSLELPVLLLMQCKELRCRAWDESNNCQPANLTWNLMCAQPPLLLVQSGTVEREESPFCLCLPASKARVVWVSGC